MDVSTAVAINSNAAGEQVAMATLKLAKDQMDAQGEAVLALIASAAPAASTLATPSGNPMVGSIINTTA